MVQRIDVHSRFLPECYRAALAAAGHSKPSGMPAIPEWNVNEHLEMLDRNQIGSAILSVSAPGVHFGDSKAARDLARNVNEEGAKVAQDKPVVLVCLPHCRFRDSLMPCWK
ncbi:hypothetical protein [Buttiauxella sp.]|uniref:hypothetical protein n=1 Tax=Buttiauxella sp. TaxID=1972222 RepID=UPI003C743DAD